jgi:hypothetical protein
MAEKTAAPPATPPADSGNDGYAVKLGRKIARYKSERDESRAKLEAAEKELAELKAKPVDKTAVELRAELREIKHRAVFDKIAADLKAKPEALRDLWELSKYTPETDVADEAKIKELIGEQAKSRSYLFTEAAPSEPGKAKPAETKPPGPGNNRGGLVTNSGKFQVSRQQTRDREWMQANQAAYAKALSEGNVEWVS